MDKYYGNVCELDIIFNFQKAYFILDELLLAGEMQESSKKNVLRCISQQDSLEDMEVSGLRGFLSALIEQSTFTVQFILMAYSSTDLCRFCFQFWLPCLKNLLKLMLDLFSSGRGRCDEDHVVRSQALSMHK